MTKIHFERNCFYCEHNDIQKERMSEIKELGISTLYLNHDQTHRGRAIVALNGHVDELFELTEKERQHFTDDVSKVAKVLSKVFKADKVNYAIYGDAVSHLHVHLVPKYKTDEDFGDAFVNMPKDPVLVSDSERVELTKIFTDALEGNK